MFRRACAFLIALASACGGCEQLEAPIYTDCGDGNIDAPEVCDGRAFGGVTCETLGYSGGTLGCQETCGGFVVSGCEGLRDRVDPCTLCADWEGCAEGRCVATCDLQELDTSTAVTFDLEVRQVTGTIGGATDGTLVLEGPVYWEPARVSVDEQGLFEVRASPGSYDLTWQPPEGRTRAAERLGEVVVGDDSELPDVSLTAVSDVQLVVDTPGSPNGTLVFEALDSSLEPLRVDAAEEISVQLADSTYRVWWEHTVDERKRFEFLETIERDELAERGSVLIDLVDVEVSVLLNGSAPRSDGGTRVELVLSGEVPRPAWVGNVYDREIVTLDDEGRASARILNRPRDVALVGNGPPFAGWLWIAKNTPTDALTFDLELHEVRGEVLRNGERLPNSEFDDVSRGRVELSSPNGSVSAELTDRGRGDFSLLVPSGQWTPSVTGVIYAKALPVLAVESEPISVTKDIEDTVLDVPAVRLAGQLLIDGDAAPDEPDLQTRGTLQIRHVGQPIWHTVPIAPSGAAVWDFIVAPGEYEAELARWWFGTGGESAPEGVLPLGSWNLGRFEVAGPTRFDADVPLVSIDVQLTDGGEAAPNGLLWFEDVRAQRLAREYRTPDVPMIRLYPGYYRVLWVPEDDDGLGTPVVLDRLLTADGDQTVQYDVGTIDFTGTLAVAGEVIEGAGPMEVSFARQPSANSGVVATIPEAGPASFSAALYPGAYTITTTASEHPALPQHGLLLERACR